MASWLVSSSDKHYCSIHNFVELKFPYGIISNNDKFIIERLCSMVKYILKAFFLTEKPETENVESMKILDYLKLNIYEILNSRPSWITLHWVVLESGIRIHLGLPWMGQFLNIKSGIILHATFQIWSPRRSWIFYLWWIHNCKGRPLEPGIHAHLDLRSMILLSGNRDKRSSFIRILGMIIEFGINIDFGSPCTGQF